MSWLTPTDWQADVLAIPEQVSLLLAGGRGPGKTTAALMDVIRHCTKYKRDASVLVVRETLKSLSEFEDELTMALTASFGQRGVRANRADHTFRLPSGATVECAPLEGPGDYAKLQGRSFSLIVADEVGNFRTLRWLEMLRANLRAPRAVPTRLVWGANPGGRSHVPLQQRFITKCPPWAITEIDGREWCVVHGTLDDNPHLPPDYRRNLAAACGRDAELLRAWETGSWSIARGAFFADVIAPERQMLPEIGFELPHDAAYSYLACDWGITAPAVCYACVHALAPIRVDRRANCPVREYPRGSVILLDEVHTADPDDWSVGMGWSPGRLADAIHAMAARTGCSTDGVIDDARGLGSDETLIGLMEGFDLYFDKPAKHRASGWAKMRELLHNSAEGNGRPGLYVSARCGGFWATVPSCPRDPLHPEELDTRAIDHFADATRYAVTSEPRLIQSGPLWI